MQLGALGVGAEQPEREADTAEAAQRHREADTERHSSKELKGRPGRFRDLSPSDWLSSSCSGSSLGVGDSVLLVAPILGPQPPAPGTPAPQLPSSQRRSSLPSTRPGRGGGCQGMCGVGLRVQPYP